MIFLDYPDIRLFTPEEEVKLASLHEQMKKTFIDTQRSVPIVNASPKAVTLPVVSGEGRERVALKTLKIRTPDLDNSFTLVYDPTLGRIQES